MKKITVTREELEEAILHSLEENIKLIITGNEGFQFNLDFHSLANQIVDDIILEFDIDYDEVEDDDFDELEFEIDDDDDEYEEDYEEDEII